MTKELKKKPRKSQLEEKSALRVLAKAPKFECLALGWIEPKKLDEKK